MGNTLKSCCCVDTLFVPFKWKTSRPSIDEVKHTARVHHARRRRRTRRTAMYRRLIRASTNSDMPRQCRGLVVLDTRLILVWRGFLSRQSLDSKIRQAIESYAIRFAADIVHDITAARGYTIDTTAGLPFQTRPAYGHLVGRTSM